MVLLVAVIELSNYLLWISDFIIRCPGIDFFFNCQTLAYAFIDYTKPFAIGYLTFHFLLKFKHFLHVNFEGICTKDLKQLINI